MKVLTIEGFGEDGRTRAIALGGRPEEKLVDPEEDWLYQMTNGADWGVAEYRLQVWEGKTVDWPAGEITGRNGVAPQKGDSILLFFAPSASRPSDYLKLDPIWTKATASTMDRIRGRMKQGTLRWVPPNELVSIQREVRTHFGAC